MLDQFHEHPGRLYVLAAMLPLLPAMLILLAGAAKNLARSAASEGGFTGWVYRRLGGDRPQMWGAYLSVACMAVVTIQGVGGLIPFLTYTQEWQGLASWTARPAISWPLGSQQAYYTTHHSPNWDFDLAESVEWIRIGPGLTTEVGDGSVTTSVVSPREGGQPTATGPTTQFATREVYRPGTTFLLGYRVDTLAALLFAVVTVVATLVFIFSLGYIRDERGIRVEDHEAHIERRGRHDRFFAYLSLFVSAMLNLLIAHNLLQVFVFWELVGATSYLLIGFYTERPSAASAATKAFIVNRVGDAGFLVAIAAAWSVAGTLTISSLPGGDSFDEFSHTYRLLLGLGLFLGCVGKSAQVPLQVWLPDAMTGPTPVSALIHAATMVAAGVYLAVRCRWLFTPEVYLVIAYTGCVTLLLGATAACFQTDIKRILAYSTVSQLGLMMLGVGVVGVFGPSSAVFHLFTHAFFKALLFLGAGSVIWGLHHEQDIRNMGGLRRKMPLTAYTTLIGVLAISGFPFLSGWYSKESILSDATFAAFVRPEHAALAVVPFFVAGLTTFYMFRLWFLIFAGEPRDPETFGHAHEAPLVMTVPLVILAAFSICAGWGWPVWESDSSFVRRILLDRLSIAHSIHWIGAGDDNHTRIGWAMHQMEQYHLAIEIIAGLAAACGFGIAYWMYRVRGIAPTNPRGIRAFFLRAWYFDALYRTLIVRPALRLSFALAATDKRPGSADGTGSDPSASRFDFRTLDGWLNSVGLSAASAGASVRRFQTGWVRGYVLALGLTVVGLLGMLAALNR